MKRRSNPASRSGGNSFHDRSGHTDHISLLQHVGSVEGERLRDRMSASSDGDIVTTVITLEEQMRGWLQAIARHSHVSRQAVYYDRLIAFVHFFANWRILPFGERAAQAFLSLQQARVRIATTDLKIAAIAISENATLLSRNMRDFERVPGLHVEDWSKP